MGRALDARPPQGPEAVVEGGGAEREEPHPRGAHEGHGAVCQHEGGGWGTTAKGQGGGSGGGGGGWVSKMGKECVKGWGKGGGGGRQGKGNGDGNGARDAPLWRDGVANGFGGCGRWLAVGGPEPDVHCCGSGSA